VTLRTTAGWRAPAALPTADFAIAGYLDERRRADGALRTEAIGVLRTVDLSADRLGEATWLYRSS
jgi:hypothetical protein